MGLTWALLAGITLDAVLGEPRRAHPLVGFGRLAAALDHRLPRQRRAGVSAVLLLAAAPSALAGGLLWALPEVIGWMGAAILLWLCMAWRSLKEHARAVAEALVDGDLANARQSVARLVSRDTEAMDRPAIRRAVLESLLENAGDGVHASLFWFALGGLVAGPAGAGAAVVAHRAINTLDAMWGYRTPRYARFGWAAARADDWVNWPSARLTALSLAFAGDWRGGLRCWRDQAAALSSPNAGPVMCAGAGALGLERGGGARYHGAYRARPVFGGDAPARDTDIERAIALVGRTLWFWGAAIVLVEWLWL